jgi:hypothetical protein
MGKSNAPALVAEVDIRKLVGAGSAWLEYVRERAVMEGASLAYRMRTEAAQGKLEPAEVDRLAEIPKNTVMLIEEGSLQGGPTLVTLKLIAEVCGYDLVLELHPKAKRR